MGARDRTLLAKPGARHARTLAFVIALLGLGSPVWSSAPTPTDQLRHTVDRVLATLNDARPRAPGQAAAREVALRRAVQARFDFPETAREALGLYWRDRTPAERQQFTALFTELLQRSYLASIARYGGARVEYTGQSLDGSYATVRTRVVTRSGRPVAVDYQMSLHGDRWLVYDVIVDHVSLVDNYRTQFRDIIATSSYQNLVDRIEARLRELRAAAASSAPETRPVQGG